MAKKILIIDDDIDLVEAMRITLESEGFEIIDAQEGSKGLEKIKSEFKKDDVVIINLSGSGSKDLDIIKENAEFKIK